MYLTLFSLLLYFLANRDNDLLSWKLRGRLKFFNLLFLVPRHYFISHRVLPLSKSYLTFVAGSVISFFSPLGSVLHTGLPRHWSFSSRISLLQDITTPRCKDLLSARLTSRTLGCVYLFQAAFSSKLYFYFLRALFLLGYSCSKIYSPGTISYAFSICLSRLIDFGFINSGYYHSLGLVAPIDYGEWCYCFRARILGSITLSHPSCFGTWIYTTKMFV